jgi:hypothetical protein
MIIHRTKEAESNKKAPPMYGSVTKPSSGGLILDNHIRREPDQRKANL